MNIEQIQEQVVITSLNHMMKGSYFSICAIDSAAKVLKVNPRGQVYDILYALHCVEFSEMSRDLRNKLPEMICEVLSLENKIIKMRQDSEESNIMQSLLRLVGR